MTVGDLLDFIEKNKLDRNLPIFVQQVSEDFKEINADMIIKKESFEYNNAVKSNEIMKRIIGMGGEDDNSLEEFVLSDKELERLKYDYTQAFCCVPYDNKTGLFIEVYY